MAVVYFDSSALVKLVVAEQGTELAADLWDHCEVALSSRLAYPEVRAALAAAARNHDLSRSQYESTIEAWEEYWSATRPVEFTKAVERSAGELSERYSLRGADAVHLASALAVGDPGVIVAVWDRRLHAAVTSAGLRVVPAVIDLS